MYTIKFTSEFKRQMKLCERRGYDMELLRTARSLSSSQGGHEEEAVLLAKAEEMVLN